MNSPLTLARLHTAVPHVLVPPTLRGENAKLARYLLQASTQAGAQVGAFRASDVPRRWSDPLAVCRTALERWVRRHTGPLRCIEPRFWLEPLAASPNSTLNYTSASRGGGKKTSEDVRFETVRLAWCCEVRQWPVGAGLEGLEHLLPGLGATALNILTQRSDWIAPLFTPVVAEYWAEWLYWYGDRDEEAALQENCGDDEQAKEAMRADMVTRAKLDAAFPAWALYPWQHRLPSAALKAAVTAGWPGSAAQVVADLLRLDRLKVQDDCRPDIDGEFIGFAAVLSWSEDDMTVRIFDDGVNLASQAEYCDIAGERMVSMAAPEEMAAWLKGMRRRMRVMALVDRLIWRLAQADWVDATAHADIGTARQPQQEAHHEPSPV